MDQFTDRLEGITHHPYAFSMVCFLVYFIAGLLIFTASVFIMYRNVSLVEKFVTILILSIVMAIALSGITLFIVLQLTGLVRSEIYQLNTIFGALFPKSFDVSLHIGMISFLFSLRRYPTIREIFAPFLVSIKNTHQKSNQNKKGKHSNSIEYLPSISISLGIQI